MARQARRVLADRAHRGTPLKDARAALLESVRRANVPLIRGRSFSESVHEAAAVMGLGAGSESKPAVLVNVGGSLLALGDCLEAADIPYGLISEPIRCTRGTPGAGSGRYQATSLGACGFATPIMINDDFHDGVTPERVPGILARYV